MQNSKLEFVIANEPDLDFDLVQEAWLDEQLIADVRFVKGNWQVIIYSDRLNPQFMWEVFSEIHRTFSIFIQEQSTST